VSEREGQEFLLNNETGYQYGMFHQEMKSKYYISDKTITDIIEKVNWELDSTEKSYINQWRRFEEIHRKYCLNQITLEDYKQMINDEYERYVEELGYEFGECCDELINHILRYLK
jgi:hypothetical protein